MTPEAEHIKEILDQHIPSLTDEDEREILSLANDLDSDAGDFGLRTCACGIRVDGFYEYVDHLKNVFGIT